MNSTSKRVGVSAVPHEKTGSRSAIDNAGWDSFGTLWSIGMSFVIAPVMILQLGVQQYGLLLIWSLTGMPGLAGLGFGEGCIACRGGRAAGQS